MKIYQTPFETIIKNLDTSVTHGLSDQEVKARHKKYGYNVLKEIKPRTVFSIFISQFQNPLVYILFCAALIIFIFGEDKLDAFIIGGVLFFNAILGTIQENRTKNIIENLKRYVKTESVVLRNGTKIIIDDKNLVVGDIIFLQEGQRVPADARIINANNVRIDESVLTGEAHTVAKNSDLIVGDVPLGDRKNMIFKGTYVVAGSGSAVVTAIAIDTEIGKIQVITQEFDTDIPLRKELERLSHWILIFIVCVCTFLFGIGIATGKPIKELLVMLTALFICVVPEGLPVVLTLVLVAGALQMAKHFVLVRNMQAVEALGRTNVIIIDKTGTLTRNEMIVSQAWTADNDIWQVTGQGYHYDGNFSQNGVVLPQPPSDNTLTEMAIAAALLNNAEIIYLSKLDIFNIKGDPTEAALFVFSQKMKSLINDQIPLYKKIYEIPFNSVTRYHAGFYRKDDKNVAFIIGSPEAVLARSSAQQAATTALKDFLAQGLRVVAIGIKELPTHVYDNANTAESYQALLDTDVQLLGFAGIEDSIRTEVATAIHDARQAGLSVIMATGDHKITAMQVAQRVGIFREGDECIDGSEIDNISEKQLSQRIDHVTVFSRLSAEHKMRIVQLLQHSGKIVAMTGDGINDAPSLVIADLGIAMGSSTEVAKQAADLVLLNDSFATIVNAIEEGRHIFYTLKRIILYFFSTNMGEILIVLFALLAGLFTTDVIPLPITAVQILWLNLVTDGFLDVGLSMEPKEPGLLTQAWLEKKHRLIDGTLILKMLFMAIPMGIGSLAVFLFYYKTDLAHARTMTVVTMAMYQWFNAWNCRSENRSLFELGLFSNTLLIVVMALVLFLQSAIVYVPFMRYIFKTVPLSLHDWIVIICITAPIVLIEELRKFVVRKNFDSSTQKE